MTIKQDLLFLLVLVLLVFSGRAHSVPADWTLKWNPNVDPVDGYIVFIGNTIDTTTIEFRRVLHNDSNKDANGKIHTVFNPSELTNTAIDVCFRLKAYNAVGESGFSEALCGKKPVVPKIPTGLVITSGGT